MIYITTKYSYIEQELFPKVNFIVDLAFHWKYSDF